jgi:hypothetical protein
MDKQIRIIPKRRVLDVDRLAEALLDLVDTLGPEERQRFAAEGERLLQEQKKGRKARKGSAA